MFYAWHQNGFPEKQEITDLEGEEPQAGHIKHRATHYRENTLIAWQCIERRGVIQSMY
jgi:hypothetical protein